MEQGEVKKNRLEKYLKKIDTIDATLVKLLAKRLRVVGKKDRIVKRYDIVEKQRDSKKLFARLKKIMGAQDENEEKLVEEIWSIILEYEDNLKQNK